MTLTTWYHRVIRLKTVIVRFQLSTKTRRSRQEYEIMHLAWCKLNFKKETLY